MWQGMNQRKFPRANYKCVVKLHQKGGGTSIPAVTENIGLGWVCIILEQGLDIFSPVDLEITLDDGKGAVKAQGTIVWVVRRRQIRKKPQFDTGVEFSGLSALNKARLEAVLDKTSQTR
jgi:hypothetical protein